MVCGHPVRDVFRPDPNLQVKFSTSFWEFYLLGRLLSVAYTILSIPLIYLIGKRTFGGRVGLAGAWLFVFYTLAIYHAQMVRTDSVALFWTLASLWYCLRISAKPTRNNHLLAGLAIGLGIASRYFLVTLVPILLIIDSFMLWQQAPPSPKNNCGFT